MYGNSAGKCKAGFSEAERIERKNMKEPVRILHVLGGLSLGGAESRIMDLYRSIDREKMQFDFWCIPPVRNILIRKSSRWGECLPHSPF